MTMLMLSDNATQVVLALIGLIGVIIPVTITAWVAFRLHKLAPSVTANTDAVARMEPRVDEVRAEVIDMAPKVTAIDNAVNNRLPQDKTLRETAEATGAAVVRIEAEQVRIESESRATPPNHGDTP